MAHLRYDMFDLSLEAAEAARLDRCETIYHKGHEQAWDGREVLRALVEEHGGVSIPEDKKESLQRIFAIILWGELAAWKISAQLADMLVPLGAKMAATSQVFDEARHFYVLHDYLQLTGEVPKKIGWVPEKLLNTVLSTNDPAEKLLGMQLLIETIALGIFQDIRESGIDPVLCELLKYFEKDEARHVGLGMQYLPVLIREQGRGSIAKLMRFQTKLLLLAIIEAKAVEPDLKNLGISPTKLIHNIMRKQFAATKEAYEAVGVKVSGKNGVSRTIRGVVDSVFDDSGKGVAHRALVACRGFLEGYQGSFTLKEFDVHKHALKWVKR